MLDCSRFEPRCEFHDDRSWRCCWGDDPDNSGDNESPDYDDYSADATP